MSTALWNPETSRGIRKRLIIEGSLTLQTPASLGNGDQDDQVDLPLLVDALDGRPLLTGASLAGALRSYLNEIDPSLARLLFGVEREATNGEQSPLVVEDAWGDAKFVEVRDGVRIDPRSRTAAHDALYTRELWAAGTVFHLRFELVICEDRTREPAKTAALEASLKRALATALEALEEERISVGGRKTRGYGRAKVETWSLIEYDLTKGPGLSAWLGLSALPSSSGSISNVLAPGLPDTRRRFVIDACFSLDGSLLIRSAGRKTPAPDAVHLKARHVKHSAAPGGAATIEAEERNILSGTALAGALRARTAKIGNTLGKNGEKLAEDLFGPPAGGGQTRSASRVSVWETEITNAVELTQFHVSIDRFTGGARNALLFNERPLFGDELTLVPVHIELKEPKSHEIALLLLLLKDLWTGDLPVGGEASIGRGRLKGVCATLTYMNTSPDGQTKTVAKHELKANGDKVEILEPTREFLATTLAAWTTWCGPGDKAVWPSAPGALEPQDAHLMESAG